MSYLSKHGAANQGVIQPRLETGVTPLVGS